MMPTQLTMVEAAFDVGSTDVHAYRKFVPRRVPGTSVDYLKVKFSFLHQWVQDQHAD